MRTRAGVLLAAALLTVSTARAELRDSVDWARQHGCRSRVAHAPLAVSTALDRAAQRLAQGQSLHAALLASGYLAVQSSAVHLSGAGSDAEITRLLTANDCAALLDPGVTQMGSHRQGRDVWLVLAAPVWLPAVPDAPAVDLQILELVNQARASGRRCGAQSFAAAPPLRLNAALTGAALAHSQDMAAHGEFDHRGHDGSSPSTRVTRAGYGNFAVVGENIAAGAMTPREVTQGWLASPPHCENIMDPRFTEIGIAFAVNVSSAEWVYWTQDFAVSRAGRPGRP